MKDNNAIRYEDKMLVKHYDQLKAILQALHFTCVRMSTQYQDTSLCTDIVAIHSSGFTANFGVRIRTSKCRQYSDFTVRALKNGVSQIDKLLTSPITHYIYAWQNEDGLIDRFYIINMVMLKQSKEAIDQINSNFIKNTDESSAFHYITMKQLKKLNLITFSYGI